jgi:protein phosphatase
MVLYLMPYKVSVHGLSDVGLVRSTNEDAWGQVVEELFFVLADGMGGHQAGEVAAKYAVEQTCQLFKEKISQSDKTFEKSQAILHDVICAVNNAIFEMGQKQLHLKGMGTTLCCVFLHPAGLIYAHAGDSRIYRLRNRQLRQLTKDDSLMQELISMGQLDAKHAHDFMYKNIITKAIGTELNLNLNVQTDTLLVGDTLLLCTDGLTDLLGIDDIQKIMIQYPEQEIAAQLIAKAKEKGGHDNVTVIVVKVQEKNDPTYLS